MDEHLQPPAEIAAEDWAATPASVRALVLVLLDRLRDLEARLNQHSANSSKPPSSDPPSAPPRPTKTPRGRPRGGQVGHVGATRPLIPPEQVDEIVPLYPDTCPRCQTALAPTLPEVLPLVRTQVWDIPPIQPSITEYQQHTLVCPTCQSRIQAPLPSHAPPTTFGPHATALAGLLHGRYRLSERETADFLAAVCGLPISLGSIASCCERVSTALAPIDAAVHALVQTQAVANIDETSWREENRRVWLWTMVTAGATCFRIAAGRGRTALQALLGEQFGGIVGSDRLKAYNILPDGRRQICWAHLLRNLRHLADYQHPDSWWAERMLAQVDGLFLAWHAYRNGLFDHVLLQQALVPIRSAMRELLTTGRAIRWYRIQGFSAELLTHWDALWTFSTTDGVEPTNNAAERALRPAVLWRKGCFGTQSVAGSRFVERVLTVTATCAQQGRKLFDLLVEALRAAWSGQPAPVLVSPP
jgi:transposase